MSKETQSNCTRLTLRQIHLLCTALLFLKSNLEDLAADDEEFEEWSEQEIDDLLQAFSPNSNLSCPPAVAD